MNKKFKRIISLAVAAVMLFMLIFSSEAFVCTQQGAWKSQRQEGIYTYYVDSNGAVITSVNEDVKGDVVVPEKLGGHKVYALGNSVFAGKDKITSIKLPDSVSRIDSGAFMNCQKLKSIDIPDGVKVIDPETFYNCYALEQVDFPSSLTEIMNYAFANCYPLKNVAIPSGVKSIAKEAFAGTSFWEKESNWKNDMLYLGHMLVASKSFLSGKISVKEGTTVINANAFSGTAVTEIVLPEGVEYIGYEAFYGCAELKKINLPSTVKEIDDCAFADCTSLTKLTIPEGMTEISGRLFDGCTNLENVLLPKSVTEIDVNAFNNTPILKEALEKDGCLYLNNILVRVDPSQTGEFTVKDGTIGIASWAFYFCSDITSLVLPDSLKYIHQYGIVDCYGLKEITIPDSISEITLMHFPRTVEVINIGKGTTEIDFENILSDVKINIHKDNPGYLSEENVIYSKDKTVLYKSFDYTSDTYVLPDSVTEICDKAFENTKYTSITLHDNVKRIGKDAFIFSEYRNKNLKDQCLYVGKYLVEGNGTKVVVKDGTLLIADNALGGHWYLEEIYVPASVKYVGETFVNSSEDVKKITIASPNTKFCDCSFKFAGPDVTVYGYTGSQAHKQAQTYGLKFVSIGTFEELIPDSSKTKLSGEICIAVQGLKVSDFRKYASKDVVITTAGGGKATEKMLMRTGMTITDADNADVKYTVAVFGDVDGDGAISANDARTALRASVGLEKLTPEKKLAANVDMKEGKITAADARLILRASVKLENLKDFFPA